MSTIKGRWTACTFPGGFYTVFMPYPSQIDAATLGALALGVVEAKGWDNWSLREVASTAGVSPNALYRHVDGRRGLDVAIAVEAARSLRSALTSAKPLSDPVLATKDLAHRYIDFAVGRPEAYRAFAEGKPLPSDPGIVEWLYLWVDFRSVVRPAAPNAVDAAGFAIWCYIHGRVELARSAARLAPIKAGVDETIDALLTGYATATVASPLPTELQSLVEALESNVED